MKRNINKLIWIIVAVVVIGAMATTLMRNKKTVDARKEVVTVATEIAVTAVPAEMKEISKISQFMGTTAPDKLVTVAAESGGKITAVNFKLGDYVNKGSLLAQTDDATKITAVENAQIMYNKSKDDYERYKILQQGEAVTDVQLRDMKATYENAEIQLKNAKKQLDYTRITAPFSGYITAKNIELGAYVNTGNPIATIADISQLKVAMTVSEIDAYKLSKGQEVTVNADVYPNVDFKGTVTNINPQGSNSHTYPIEVSIANNGKNQLKAGTSVKVIVNSNNNGKALLIPRDAIVSSVKDPSVYVVDGNIAKLIKINIGSSYKSFIEVVSGLNEGDRVITNGQINLTDGSKIVINKK